MTKNHLTGYSQSVIIGHHTNAPELKPIWISERVFDIPERQYFKFELKCNIDSSVHGWINNEEAINGNLYSGSSYTEIFIYKGTFTDSTGYFNGRELSNEELAFQILQRSMSGEIYPKNLSLDYFEKLSYEFNKVRQHKIWQEILDETKSMYEIGKVMSS